LIQRPIESTSIRWFTQFLHWSCMWYVSVCWLIFSWIQSNKNADYSWK
jgi:hypothetical protein